MARLFVSATLLLTCAAQAQPQQKSDHERLQGKWEVVAMGSLKGTKTDVVPGTLFITSPATRCSWI